MRKYLFRAKRVDNEEWVEGSLLDSKQNENCEIRKWSYCYIVIPATVGQFTGLTDKNSKKIFEGDLLKICTPKYTTVRKVEYAGAQYVAVAKDGGECDFQYITDIEVIGNIYDNPDKFIDLSANYD